MARIEVYPNKQGEWRWRHEGSKPSKAFDTRGEAFEQALIARSDEQIVLLRQDGSVHGELYQAKGSERPAQRVDILAASENSEAVNRG